MNEVYNIEELFVNNEIANLAKQYGFNDPCFAKFYKKHFHLNTLTGPYRHNSGEISTNYVSAPTWEQLVNWFGRVHNIYIDTASDTSDYYTKGINSIVWKANVYQYNNLCEIINYSLCDVNHTFIFKTKQEMLIVAIKEAFKFLK